MYTGRKSTIHDSWIEFDHSSSILRRKWHVQDGKVDYNEYEVDKSQKALQG